MPKFEAILELLHGVDVGIVIPEAVPREAKIDLFAIGLEARSGAGVVYRVGLRSLPAAILARERKIVARFIPECYSGDPVDELNLTNHQVCVNTKPANMLRDNPYGKDIRGIKLIDSRNLQ